MLIPQTDHLEDKMDTAATFVTTKDDKAGELAPYLLNLLFKIGKHCIKKHSVHPQSSEVRKLCKMKIVVVNSNLYTGNAVVERDQLLKTTYITSIIWCTCGFMISCYIIVNIVNISGVPAGL